VGILWDRTLDYKVRKAKLSPKRQEFLEYVEEDLASNPDRFRFESEDGVRYRYIFEEGVSGFVAFELTDRYHGLLIDFGFADQA
jgi:hypothetical protein